jgi:hypothetical protein
MPNLFVIPETTIRGPGIGPQLALETEKRGWMVFTMNITRVVERQSLDVSVWGSANGADWGEQPLLRFRRKFYCGTDQVGLDATHHDDLRFLRATWRTDRWGSKPTEPAFTVLVRLQEYQCQTGSAAALGQSG